MKVWYHPGTGTYMPVEDCVVVEARSLGRGTDRTIPRRYGSILMLDNLISAWVVLLITLGAVEQYLLVKGK